MTYRAGRSRTRRIDRAEKREHRPRNPGAGPQLGSALPAKRESVDMSLTAVAMVVASAACFTAIDTIVKYLGLRYSVPTLVWARWGVPALLMLLILGPKMRWGLVRTTNPKLHLIRGAVLMLSSLCFFSALKLMPLAEATGLNYSTPILVTLMAGWFLGEKITRQRWLFVAAGFIGMLLIIQPGSGVLNAATFLALMAAALNATFQILTRKLAREDLMVLIFYPTLVGAVLMSLTVQFLDSEVSYLPADIVLLLATGAIGGLGHFLFIQAFQRAPASAIAPFTYMQLVWSTLAGWLVFGSFPDGWALSGLTVIAASGAALMWHERRRGRVTGTDPSRLAGRQGAMIAVPGAGLAGIAFDGSAMALGGSGFHGIRDATLIPSGRESSRTLIKTD